MIGSKGKALAIVFSSLIISNTASCNALDYTIAKTIKDGVVTLAGADAGKAVDTACSAIPNETIAEHTSALSQIWAGNFFKMMLEPSGRIIDKRNTSRNPSLKEKLFAKLFSKGANQLLSDLKDGTALSNLSWEDYVNAELSTLLKECMKEGKTVPYYAVKYFFGTFKSVYSNLFKLAASAGDAGELQNTLQTIVDSIDLEGTAKDISSDLVHYTLGGSTPDWVTDSVADSLNYGLFRYVSKHVQGASKFVSRHAGSLLGLNNKTAEADA